MAVVEIRLPKKCFNRHVIKHHVTFLAFVPAFPSLPAGVITKAGPHSPIALSILLRLLALSGDLNDWLFFGATLAMSTPAVAALRVDAGCQGHLTEFFRNVRHARVCALRVRLCVQVCVYVHFGLSTCLRQNATPGEESVEGWIRSSPFQKTRISFRSEFLRRSVIWVSFV